MIIYLSLIIPIIAVLILLFWFNKRVTVWEYVFVFGIPLITIFIAKHISTSVVDSQEYITNKVISVRYYEPWNEYIHKTCSYTTCTGSGKTESCTTHYYDCSYVEEHREHWTALLNNQQEVEITREQYLFFKLTFKSPSTFVELNRNYYTKDGNRYDNAWLGEENTVQHYTWLHSYEDKVRHEGNVFNFLPVSKEDVTKFKLFEYPQIKNPFGNYTVLASKPSYTTEIYNIIASRENALVSQNKQCKIWILLFNDSQPYYSSMLQEQYWKKGNKNELVICIGLDSTNKIKWNRVFSWTDHSIIHINISNYLHSEPNKTLRPITFIHYLKAEVEKNWQRKSFSEFNHYLTIEPTLSAIIWSYIIVLFVTILVVIFVIYNEIDP